MSGDELAIFWPFSGSLLPQQVAGWQVGITVLLQQNKQPTKWDIQENGTSIETGSKQKEALSEATSVFEVYMDWRWRRQ